ncbi:MULTISPECIES: FtsX-like permease family protein [Winkia]|uniref:FtsX-like permease family protein n=1 Tax=Winkia TaxID=2692118 RepID=UPI0006615910|nr:MULTISPECIES: FtsX-like permease family protein [Winkia]MDK7229217.1 hypothetical protein [Winkia sp. UMB1185]WEB73153.1 hypothetical protein PUW51_02290 [Winkia neuii]
MPERALQAKNLLSTTAQIARHRFGAASGEGPLVLASVGAFTVVSAITYLVATGTYMFWRRFVHPVSALADWTLGKSTAGFYFLLALLALALLIGPLTTLASSASLLGANAREHRMATLRLLGVSQWGIVKIAGLETMLQASIGTVCGFALCMLALPPLHKLSFQGSPLLWREMFLPPLGYLACALAIVLLSGEAATLGLRRVIISPQGVVRKSRSRKLRGGRALLFVASATAAIIIPSTFANNQMQANLLLVIMVLLVAGWTMVMAMPYLLRLVARAFAASSNLVVSVSARRIMAAPRDTWRRVAGVAFLSIIAGAAATTPRFGMGMASHRDEQIVLTGLADVKVGVGLTVLFGFLLAAASTLLAGLSAEYEHSRQTRALARMGAPDSFALKVSFTEALAPVAGVCLIGYLIGVLNAFPTMLLALNNDELSRQDGLVAVLTGAVVVVGGIALVAFANALTIPVHRKILAENTRKVD